MLLSFAQLIPTFDIKEIWEQQLYLSKYAGIAVDLSDLMIFEERKAHVDKVNEWRKEEAKYKANRDQAFLNALKKLPGIS